MTPEQQTKLATLVRLAWVQTVLLGVVVLWLFLITGVALSTEYVPTSTPRDAVADAILDCSRLSPIDRPFVRYFWLPAGSAEELAAFQYTLNAAVSNAQSIQHGRVVTKNLVAVNLREILPDSADFIRVFGVLENHIDPFFHVVQRVQVFEDGQFVVVVSKVAIWQSGTKVIGNLKRGRIGEVTDTQGTWVQIRVDGRHGWVQAKEIAVVSFGLHVLPRPEIDEPFRIVDANLLSTLTQSRCPIFTLPHFLPVALSTVDGGIYYDLIGVKGLKLDAALARFGIDAKQFNNPKSTSRSAVFVSKVTGKPRAGKFGFGSGVRPTEGTALWTATEDTADDDLDAGQHAIYSLRGANFRAGETIVPKANNFLAGLIYLADETLQDEVTPNVARDHQATPPHHARINGWFSCMRCHADSGYQDFANDVQLLVKQGGGFYFGDLTVENQAEAVDELRGQYEGDMDRPLDEARRAHAATVFKATGMPYEQARDAVIGVYEGYEYAWTTPQSASRWLGYDVTAAEAPKMFADLVPPLPNNALGFSPEDPTVLGLRAWRPAIEDRPAGPEIRVRDFERVFPDLFLRSMAYKPEVKK